VAMIASCDASEAERGCDSPAGAGRTYPDATTLSRLDVTGQRAELRLRVPQPLLPQRREPVRGRTVHQRDARRPGPGPRPTEHRHDGGSGRAGRGRVQEKILHATGDLSPALGGSDRSVLGRVARARHQRRRWESVDHDEILSASPKGTRFRTANCWSRPSTRRRPRNGRCSASRLAEQSDERRQSMNRPGLTLNRSASLRM